MGTDCGIAILKEDKFERIYLGRYYAFNGNIIRTMTWMNGQDLLTIVNQSREYIKDSNPGRPDLDKMCNDILNTVVCIIRDNADALFAIYNDSDWNEDDVNAYKHSKALTG